MAEQFPWDVGVFEAHCHICNTIDVEATVTAIHRMKARGLVVLPSRAQNQDLTAQLARRLSPRQHHSDDQWSFSEKVIPGFGWHPWYSHLLYLDRDSPAGHDMLSEEAKLGHYRTVLSPAAAADVELLSSLPDPRPLSTFLAQTRRYLEEFPTALVGEIGLDKSFRIPVPWSPDEGNRIPIARPPGSREGRRLTDIRVNVDHQIAILMAQLALAAEMSRPVSVHGVQVHGILFDTLSQTWKGCEIKSKKQQRLLAKRQATAPPETTHQLPKSTLQYPPRICLHSYSGSPDLLKAYLDPKIPAEIFFSFSTFNNFSQPFNKAEASVRLVPDHMLLLETDLSNAGDELDHQLDVTARKLCELKGWTLAHGLQQMRKNWLRFVFGNDMDQTRPSRDS